MSCERIRDLLEDASGGPAAEKAGLESHLQSCAACREYRDTLRQTVRAFEAVGMEPFPEHRSQKIMLMVRQMPSPARRSLWERISELLTPQKSWAFAAVPAMAALLLAFWPRGTAEQPGVIPPKPSPGPQPVQVAKLLGTVEAGDAIVTVAGKRLAGQAEFADGSEIALESGAAMLRYHDGTRVRLEKKARAKAGVRSLQLLEGKALAAVSQTGKGFELKSCQFTVRVMGTRFSVDSAMCDVQLLEGKIETFAGSGAAATLTAGQGIVHEPGKATRRQLTADEKRDLTNAFLRFESAPQLAAALGMTEDELRESVRPPKAAEAEPATAPAQPTPQTGAQPPASKPAPFVPLQGLQNK